ncbi:MAG TPA: universal stress protein, partial [Polyangiales bacterium]
MVALGRDANSEALFHQGRTLAGLIRAPLWVVRGAPKTSVAIDSAAWTVRAIERRGADVDRSAGTPKLDIERAVAAAAERWRPVLILVAAAHVDGALVARLAKQTTVPVLVWRASVAPAVFAATNLRDPRYTILRCGNDLAAWLRAPVVAFHNVTTLADLAFPPTPYAIRSATERTLQTRKADLDSVLERLEIRARSVVMHRSSTANAILETADRERAGLIVVGTQRRGWW